MNDLNQIRENNNRAVQRDIPSKLKAGRYVTAEFTGLHFVGYHDFATRAEAQAKANEINARGDSSNAKLQSPHPELDSKEAVAA